MPYEKGFHPGAIWLKCDFQCHTPRDRDWIGATALPGGNDSAENDRRAWAESFVQAALDRRLGAVAITDHHDICISEYVLEAASRLNAPLVIFPGIEITCKDNAQCLAVFDPSVPAERQRDLLVKAGNVTTADKREPKTNPVDATTVTVEELCDEIHREQFFLENCVLLPHFSNETSHKSLNSDGHHLRFAKLQCDGVYIEHPFSDLTPSTLDKIQGRIPEWGHRRRAILATGDNRSESWARLGKHDCWIKLGEPTIEAIRQALLADEARISFTQPETPSERIVSLKVQSSLTGPTPLYVEFNAGFSALIGGRGSGKTSILQYLRFALGRTRRDLAGPGLDLKRERDAQLIDETLQNGFVEVELEREGVREKWRRTLTDRGMISVVDNHENTTTLTIAAAQDRFRARAFDQKGLSSTMNDPQHAAEQITGIAAAEERDKRVAIDAEIGAAQRGVTTALQQLAAYWQLTLEHGQVKARVVDLRARLHAISERLTREGVSPEHISTIENAPKYSRAKSFFDQAHNRLGRDIEKLGDLAESILHIDITQYDGVSEFEEIANFNAKLSTAQKDISARLAAAKNLIQNLIQDREEGVRLFEIRHQKFLEEYSHAVEQQSAHRALINDSNRLAEELKTAESQEVSIATKVTESESAQGIYYKSQETLFRLLDDRRNILRSAAEKVAGHSSNLLKARLKRDAQPKQYVQALRALFETSRVHDVENRCVDWVNRILVSDPDEGWKTICSSLLEIYKSRIFAGSPLESDDAINRNISKLLFGGSEFTSNQLQRINANLTDITVGAVLSAVPRDSIVMTYIDEGRSIPFEKASEGQQASALLELLLSQSAGTLIIDQPEDDLDNRVIMRIVELIRRSKNHRQIIFTTHNANIVVNGDADKIIALQSLDSSPRQTPSDTRVLIDIDGAIETPSVRTVITKIMEGGEAAFDLRRRKYRFDLRR